MAHNWIPSSTPYMITLPPLPTDPASYNAYLGQALLMQQTGYLLAVDYSSGNIPQQIEGAVMRISGLRMEELVLMENGSPENDLRIIRNNIEQMLRHIRSLNNLAIHTLDQMPSHSSPLNSQPVWPPSPAPSSELCVLDLSKGALQRGPHLPLTVNLTSQARNATIRLNSVPEYLPLTIVVRAAPEQQQSGVVLSSSGQVPYTIEVQEPDSSEVTINLNPQVRSDEVKVEEEPREEMAEGEISEDEYERELND